MFRLSAVELANSQTRTCSGEEESNHKQMLPSQVVTDLPEHKPGNLYQDNK
jgi:hypothetical protein